MFPWLSRATNDGPIGSAVRLLTTKNPNARTGTLKVIVNWLVSDEGIELTGEPPMDWAASKAAFPSLLQYTGPPVPTNVTPWGAYASDGMACRCPWMSVMGLPAPSVSKLITVVGN